MTEGTTDRRVDDALDKILRAAGSGKLSSYMPYTQDKLREAMRAVLAHVPRRDCQSRGGRAMTTAPAMRPCPVPWCGSRHISLESFGGDKLFVARCPSCGARSPASRSQSEAIAAWNARPGGDEAVREALVELTDTANYMRRLVVEGDVPRYTIYPGVALNSAIEALDPAIMRAERALRTHGSQP